MSTYSQYELASGVFTSVQVSSEQPPREPDGSGYAWLEGAYRHDAHRVDGDKIVDYVPPAPAADEWTEYAWDASLHRWTSTPTLAALKRDRKAPLLAEIAELEADQARPMREALMATLTAKAPPAIAVARIADIDAAIGPIRSRLDEIDSAADLDALSKVSPLTH